jgi:hypothetical protein
LLVGSVNAVLAIQGDVGKKTIVKPAKGGVRAFFVLPTQNAAQD